MPKTSTRHTERASTSALPEAFRSLFWEHDFDSLSMEEDQDLIIGRVLARGGWTEIRTLRSMVGDEELRKWITGARGRGLTPPQLRFWQLVLDLPRRRVNDWLTSRKGDPWENRTR